MFFLNFFLLIFCLLFSGNIHATDSPCTGDECKPIAVYNTWEVYSVPDRNSKQENKQICFLASAPIFSSGSYTKRGDPVVYIRHISNEISEVSATPGYPLQKDTYGEIAVSYTKDSLGPIRDQITTTLKDQGLCIIPANQKEKILMDLVVEEFVWFRDYNDDNNVVKSMKRGYYLFFLGKSRKNTCSIDVYSLEGFIKAFNKMNALCQE
ncbi:MAG: hypothetical protein P857_838 [Candidatus Xenolissoclinum pacificiensis L6]|uniref:Uncharacterized protein n=1 Tax=Candidatus Xenolissoclinum pacificiensis L6 TaxID=1401685 RepID=W2V2K2_9RICK|nr:MAG: hypothetical protein P857_838 [Candidatus Xenolissoclinum pacificiensis L6]